MQIVSQVFNRSALPKKKNKQSSKLQLTRKNRRKSKLEHSLPNRSEDINWIFIKATN